MGAYPGGIGAGGRPDGGPWGAAYGGYAMAGPFAGPPAGGRTRIAFGRATSWKNRTAYRA